MTTTTDIKNPKKAAAAGWLLFCASGIFISYSCYGVLQEHLLRHASLGSSFVLVTQTVANVFVAWLWERIEEQVVENNNKGSVEVVIKENNINKNQKSLNHPLLAFVSACYVFAMVGSNEALHYVSYPTAVLAKSCKMIPTMVMGYFVEKRYYTLVQWIAALSISFGIALFHLSRIAPPSGDNDKNHVDAESSYTWGMTLLVMSLCMDGFLGSFQGMLKNEDPTGRRRPPTAVETMFWVNLYALGLLFPMSVLGGTWSEGVQQLRNDSFLLSSIALLAAIVAIGQIFIFLTITWYSSLVCTTITTTRKFFTILFSVWHFGHHFSIAQWASVLMVFAGLYLSIFGPNGNNKPNPTTTTEKVKQT